MNTVAKKLHNKVLRQRRVRARVIGSQARPRLSVTISNCNVSAQIINDSTGHTLASSTTVGRKVPGSLADQAAVIGTELAVRAKKAAVATIVFDRNGRKYGKRLSSLAQSARSGGLEF